jgi:hypothetical protein
MDRIRQLRVVGNPKEAPKCARCGKLLVFTDKETAPNCYRCSLIIKMENAVNQLSEIAGEDHEKIIKKHLQK